MAGESPLQRSMRQLRSEGYRVAKTEHWNPFVPRPDGGKGIRQDLFGFIDALAIRGGETLAIQATSGTNHAAHIEKMRAQPALDDWLDSQGGPLSELERADLLAWTSSAPSRVRGMIERLLASSQGRRVEVWSWSKHKVKRGGKAVRWDLRREAIEPAEIEGPF